MQLICFFKSTVRDVKWQEYSPAKCWKNTGCRDQQRKLLGFKEIKREKRKSQKKRMKYGGKSGLHLMKNLHLKFLAEHTLSPTGLCIQHQETRKHACTNNLNDRALLPKSPSRCTSLILPVWRSLSQPITCDTMYGECEDCSSNACTGPVATESQVASLPSASHCGPQK